MQKAPAAFANRGSFLNCVGGVSRDRKADKSAVDRFERRTVQSDSALTHRAIKRDARPGHPCAKTKTPVTFVTGVF
jgi:hypothetical protein